MSTRITAKNIAKVFILIIYVALISIITYAAIYLPVRLLKISDEFLGAFFFMALPAYFVVIGNIIFLLIQSKYIYYSMNHKISELFLHLLKVFVPILYLSILVIGWLQSSTSSIGDFLSDVFLNSESIYLIFTSLVGVLVYYYIFSCLLLKSAFLLKPYIIERSEKNSV